MAKRNTTPRKSLAMRLSQSRISIVREHQDDYIHRIRDVLNELGYFPAVTDHDLKDPKNRDFY